MGEQQKQSNQSTNASKEYSVFFTTTDHETYSNTLSDKDKAVWDCDKTND